MLCLGALRRAQLTPTLRHSNANLRGAVLRGLSPKQKIRASGLRFETTTTSTPPKPSAPKFAYPEMLCVYHAGTGRTTFLACLKVSTLFIFTFFGFVITPACFEKEGLSPTVIRTSLSAIVPMVFVAYVTSPFVTFIHMRLPPFARQSEDMLRRFVRTIPPQTELDITTMSFIAKPRVSRVALSELQPVNRRLGIINYARDTAAENSKRKWYMFRAVGNFNVQHNTVSRAPWVWESIVNSIKRRQV
ncbi:hypothetical protein AAE478_009220 [Parahypoxylon ruwenzoriense]